MEIHMKRHCASIWWTAEDIQSKARALGENWTLTEAEAWLKRSEDDIASLLEMAGNLYITDCLKEDIKE
jgi:hypothetical protein